MTKPKTNGKPLLPGVAYIRMSSDQQEASPDQQRAEVAKLAEKYGFKIIREYFDAGISGAATSKRKQFLAMMQDAETKGDFKAILCWDQDRFGRFDSIEAGRWVHPLRERGIQLVTVAQGVIDWSDFAGRMIYSIHQEGKAQYLQDLSRNVVRGLADKARKGLIINNPPYGYDRVYFDASGKQVHRVPHGQRFRKPKDWTVRLAISEDKESVELVRWLFERMAATEVSISSMMLDLNRRGKRTRSGVFWRRDVVLDMLRNPVYCGVYVFARHRVGKFHQFDDSGEVAKAVKRAGKRRNQKAAFTIEDNHPAIVSPKLWQQVQNRLNSRKASNRRPRTRGYPLSGIVRCGHCGAAMTGHTTGRLDRESRYYVCKNSLHGVCTERRLNAQFVEGLLVGMIQDLVADDAFGAKLLAELKRQVKERKQGGATKPKALVEQIAKLEKQIQRGVKNLLEADDDTVAEARSILDDWRAQKQALEAELKAASGPKKAAGDSPEEIVGRAMKQLGGLVEHLKRPSTPEGKEAFRRLFASVTVKWHPRGEKQRNYRLAEIAIEALPKLALLSDSARRGRR